MKAWHIERFGDTDGLALRTEADPLPGRGQIVMRVRANAMNARDLNVLAGKYRVLPKTDVVPLSDGAGDVVAVGPGVSRIEVGDRVAATFMQGWLGGRIEAAHLRSDLGGSIDGMLTEYKLLDADGVVKVPAHLSDIEAATLPCAAVTAWSALTDIAPVGAGETVLTMGSGGVALFALQFARLLGARVIAITSSDARADRLRALGAHAVVNYRTHPDWEKPVLDLTHGRGVDRVVDVAGADSVTHAMQCSALGGHIVMVGRLGPGETIDPTLLRGKSLLIRTLTVGSRQQFEAMNRAIELHGLHPVVDETIAFDHAKAAYDRIRSRQHFGKVVIAHA